MTVYYQNPILVEFYIRVIIVCYNIDIISIDYSTLYHVTFILDGPSAVQFN